MSVLGAIAFKEFAGFFRTAAGPVIIALYLAISGFYVGFVVIEPGQPASLRAFFAVSQWLLLIVAPAISMRTFSEEYRSGTIEPLLAAPPGEWSVVVGKFAGIVLMLLAMLACTLPYPALLLAVSDPEPGPIVTGYLGLVLVGGVYIAGGMVCSACTSNQVLSFLATFFVFSAWWVLTDLGGPLIGPPVDELLYALSFQLRIRDFARGVVSAEHVVFFVGLALWFVMLSVVALESRRWR